MVLFVSENVPYALEVMRISHKSYLNSIIKMVNLGSFFKSGWIMRFYVLK